MPEWQGEGIILSARAFSDSASIVHVFSRENGRYAGLVQGGAKVRAQLQRGNRVDAAWMARLEEQLGRFSLEVADSPASRWLDDPARLLAIHATMSVFQRLLMERDPASHLYDALSVWLELLEGEVWAEALVKLEMGLLAYAGFGLDLTSCAATGHTEELRYVSPKSGRAVSAEAGAAYADRLLPLPGFLNGQGGSAEGDIGAGLRLTGYFLETRLYHGFNEPVPDERLRLMDYFGSAGGMPLPADDGAEAAPAD